MLLKNNIEQRRKQKDILIMAHLVLGYPSFESNRQVIEQMIEGGVDLIELQIPFSEPMADGPIILKANQQSLANGTRVSDCIEFAAGITADFDIPFLFMTYYNIIFKYGEEAFFAKAKEIAIQGFIVPDLPPEEGSSFLDLANRFDIAPILIYAPTTTDQRMHELNENANGFIYCVARRGVTGAQTDMDDDISTYLQRCRSATDLPLAVGFGIGSKKDVSFLIGKADIAVIGTKTIRVLEEEGLKGIRPFIAGLR